MYPAILSLFSSIFLHIAQEIGSLRTEVNQLAPTEERELIRDPPLYLLSTGFPHYQHKSGDPGGHTIYTLECLCHPCLPEPFSTGFCPD